MPRAKKLTPSSEDYLEAILELSEPTALIVGRHCRTSECVQSKRNQGDGICEAGLIEYAHYGLIA